MRAAVWYSDSQGDSQGEGEGSRDAPRRGPVSATELLSMFDKIKLSSSSTSSSGSTSASSDGFSKFGGLLNISAESGSIPTTTSNTTSSQSSRFAPVPEELELFKNALQGFDLKIIICITYKI